MVFISIINRWKYIDSSKKTKLPRFQKKKKNLCASWVLLHPTLSDAFSSPAPSRAALLSELTGWREKKSKLMCSCLGFLLVESLGKRLKELPLVGSWWKTPRHVFFFSFFLLVDGGGRGSEHREHRGEGCEWRWRALWCLLHPPRLLDLLQLTRRLLFCSQESRQGGRGCPFHVRPAATVWVHKGIWRAWWKPPCYSMQEQRGASRASSPTWQMRSKALANRTPVTLVASVQTEFNV